MNAPVYCRERRRFLRPPRREGADRHPLYILAERLNINGLLLFE